MVERTGLESGIVPGRHRSLEDVSGEGCQHRMDLVTSDIPSNGQESCEIEPLLSNLWHR